MSARFGRWPAPALGIALALAIGAGPSSAQQILLDKPVRAGDLNFYPDLNDGNSFYYVPDKVRIATDENGTPQFSFVRYVHNVRSGADQPEAREGEGGGIVHALVTLAVTPEQLADASRALQQLKPGAKIQGPVAFKSGRFGLVSSFADVKGNKSSQVLGLGSAPLLDGEKAAVSIELTKAGATLLWAEFDTAAPDISFHFEMDVSGFDSPLRATIDADWSKIYAHRAFGAGVATTYLAAEVKDAFDELRSSDAIKVTQVGQDDKMDAIVATAYKMIQDRMFEPVGGTGTPSLGDLASTGQGQPSLLDRASSRLKEMRAEAEATNAAIRKENDVTRARNDKVRAGEARVSGARSRAESADLAAARAEADAALLARQAKVATRYAEAMKKKSAAAAAAPAASATDTEPVSPPPSPDEAVREAADLTKQAEAAKVEAARLRGEANRLLAADSSAAGAAPGETEALKEEKTVPAISVIATLEMKTVKQSGTFHFEMNKFMPDSRTLSFSENIGDLHGLKSDPKHFLEVNMDDPLFKQRELVAMVDVANAQDFGQFINFVDVQMRKKHANGEETQDEVRVDRNNFNKEGNNFKLMYGWNGDDDRSKWMNYEYQSTWSMVGGKTVVEPWKASTSQTIDLAPPYRRRTVTLDGNPDTLQQAEVRAVTVQVYYDVAGSEQSKQATLNVAKGQVGDKIEFLAPPNSTSYAYQITWQLRGNRTLSTPRQTGVSDMLYVDELPAH